MRRLTTHIRDAHYRWLTIGLLTALVAGGGAVALAGGSGALAHAAARRGVRAARPAPANARAAQRDAAALLAKLELPSGAARAAREPAGDGGTLAQPASGPPATPNAVDDHAWWSVPGTPQQVLQYVKEHPPAGGAPAFSGTSGGGGKPMVLAIGFQWPTIRGELSLRWLFVAAVQLEDGSTGVRADSQVVWITPRPRSERIPAGARRLVVSTTKSGKLVQGPITITARTAISKAISLLNALPAFQPGVRSCPADFGWRVKLAFYAGGGRDRTASGASPLAVAVIDPNGCGVVRLTLAGKAQPALGGGYALTKRLSGALHVKLGAFSSTPA